jgi:hypothetical protein
LTCIAVFIVIDLPARAQQNEDPHGAARMSIVHGQETLPSAEFNGDSVAVPHHFFDRTNVLLFSGIAIARVLDYTSTRNMLARGREEKLIPDDVVYSTPGFVSLEAAGVATSIGISYFLHRKGHHKIERWLSIGHITVTGFGAVRNYALESRHP